MMSQMKGIVVERAGGPEVLQIRTVPTPELRPGWILIKVKAFGLNRSEIFTRRGDSPDVKFPRILATAAFYAAHPLAEQTLTDTKAAAYEAAHSQMVPPPLS
jgi:threonine dehydrogenase-like Zn-dependent dehydrogenase